MNRELKMKGELESLMRDVGRAVEADARQRNILPQVQARLAARQILGKPSASRTVRRRSAGSTSVPRLERCLPRR